MKIRIIKPFKTSGYFHNDIIETNESLIESLKENNQIEIIEDSLEDKKITTNRKGRKPSTKK